LELIVHHLQVLKNYLINLDEPITIALQGNKLMTVEIETLNNSVIGVNVNTLGASRFLSLEVFVATISLLSANIDHQAIKGNAMNGHLGDELLPFNSVEGHVAKVVYGYQKGDIVFRRITPISKILEISGVCSNGRGFLRLL